MKLPEGGVYIVSDLHGAFYTWLRLRAKLPADAQIVFNGDLIDRGPHSRQVVEYAMKNQIPTVIGNHCHLALYHHGRVDATIYGSRDIWLLNGGGDTLKSWGLDPRKGRLPDDVLDWMAALPTHLIYDKLLVSHAGHAFTKPRRALFGDDPEEMRLWYRDTSFPDDGYFRVFGHTSTEVPIITDRFANIDTGASYEGYHTMTAFHWPTKQIITQRFDESPL